jgi:hypothetical protein
VCSYNWAGREELNLPGIGSVDDFTEQVRLGGSWTPSEISEWRFFMLEDYYVKPATIDRVRSSWLAPQIESYLEWLQAHGYSRLVVYRRLPLLFHFAEFAQKKGCRDIASCKAYIKEFVCMRPTKYRIDGRGFC